MAVELTGSAGCKQYGSCEHRSAFSGFVAHDFDAATAVLAHQQIYGRTARNHFDAWRSFDPLQERADNLLSCCIACMQNPIVCVRAFSAKNKSSFYLVEMSAPIYQLLNASRSVFH